MSDAYLDGIMAGLFNNPTPTPSPSPDVEPVRLNSQGIPIRSNRAWRELYEAERLKVAQLEAAKQRAVNEALEAVLRDWDAPYATDQTKFIDRLMTRVEASREAMTSTPKCCD